MNLTIECGLKTMQEVADTEMWKIYKNGEAQKLCINYLVSGSVNASD